MRLLRKRLWLAWILANALGGLAGVMLAARIFAWQQEWTGHDLTISILRCCLFLSLGGIIWLPLGPAQALALSLFLPNFGVRSSNLWSLLSIVGAFAAILAGVVSTIVGLLPLVIVLGLPFGSSFPPSISFGFNLLSSAGLGAIGGSVVAFCQLPLLRSHTVSSGPPWTKTNMVAWAIGMAVAYIFSVMQTGSTSAGLDVAIPRETVTSILSATLAIVVASVITGSYLARHLKTSIPHILLTDSAAPPM